MTLLALTARARDYAVRIAGSNRSEMRQTIWQCRSRNSMRPLVSILIPCYNAERWIGQAIESALAQTWSEKEIIVVDDGSMDRSLEVIRQFDGRNSMGNRT